MFSSLKVQFFSVFKSTNYFSMFKTDKKFQNGFQSSKSKKCISNKPPVEPRLSMGYIEWHIMPPHSFFLQQLLGHTLKWCYSISFGIPDQSWPIWTNGNTRYGQTFVFLSTSRDPKDRLPVDLPTNQITTDHIATNHTKSPLGRFTHLTATFAITTGI